MKIIIAGRTGTMKDALKAALVEKGFTPAKSYTTRPKRTPDEDTYHFLTKEQAEMVDPEHKQLYTVLNGHERFITPATIKGSDVFILDYNGVQDLTAYIPDEAVLLVYCKAHYEAAKQAASKRGELAGKEYEERYEDERKQFDELEHALARLFFHETKDIYTNDFNNHCAISPHHNEHGLNPNIFAVIRCQMCFDDQSIKDAVDAIMYVTDAHATIEKLLKKSIDAGLSDKYTKIAKTASDLYRQPTELAELLFGLWHHKQNKRRDKKS